ncbi:MAG: hypothetical protein CVV44_03935 [Spirochaetae bacterium HGW-Spirochaetae-1]|jgi:hypothetical protein|nr:MAG: hypothetical protein CVV44_03935 [Spirochaetae bacterium HGW-Spirochaetae-1]
MSKLNPSALAKAHTLEEIDEKIAKYTAMVENATEIKLYDLSDSQTRQRVESQDADKAADILNSWYEARTIKTGQTTAKLYGGKFYRG